MSASEKKNERAGQVHVGVTIEEGRGWGEARGRVLTREKCAHSRNKQEGRARVAGYQQKRREVSSHEKQRGGRVEGQQQLHLVSKQHREHTSFPSHLAFEIENDGWHLRAGVRACMHTAFSFADTTQPLSSRGLLPACCAPCQLASPMSGDGNFPSPPSLSTMSQKQMTIQKNGFVRVEGTMNRKCSTALAALIKKQSAEAGTSRIRTIQMSLSEVNVKVYGVKKCVRGKPP